MKTLQEVNEEIQKLLDTNPKDVKRTQLSKIKNRLEFLKVIKNYLLENPTEQFVAKEVKRIEDKINAIMSQFDKSAYKEPKPAMLKFERDNKIPHLRDQLKALWFILN
jgi:hypothetical protein